MSTGGGFGGLGPVRLAIAAGALLTAWAFGEGGVWSRVAAALRRRFAQLAMTRQQIDDLRQEWERALGAGAWLRAHRVVTLPRYDHVWNPGIPDAFQYQYSFQLTDPLTGRTAFRRGYINSPAPMSPDRIRAAAAQVVADLPQSDRWSLVGAAAGDPVVPVIRLETAYRQSRY